MEIGGIAPGDISSGRFKGSSGPLLQGVDNIIIIVIGPSPASEPETKGVYRGRIQWRGLTPLLLR